MDKSSVSQNHKKKRESQVASKVASPQAVLSEWHFLHFFLAMLECFLEIHHSASKKNLFSFNRFADFFFPLAESIRFMYASLFSSVFIIWPLNLFYSNWKKAFEVAAFTLYRYSRRSNELYTGFRLICHIVPFSLNDWTLQSTSMWSQWK